MLASSNKRKVQTQAASNVAASKALFSGLTPVIDGKCWVTFYTDVAVYVAFKLGASAASVTTTTGFPWAANSEHCYFIDSQESDYIEIITATGSGTVSFHISSPEDYKVKGGF